jgi:YD repeat-containing protein
VRIRTLVIALTATMGLTLLGAGPALAQDELCPSDNPVIQENNCSGAGSDGWRITNFNDNVAGFATKTSVNLGENVPLKIGRVNAAAPSTVNVDVYRLGYYGNQGGRFLAAASHANTAVNNTFAQCSATDATTGKKSCASWAVSYTIPGLSLPASGEYEAKITDPVGGGQNSIFFTVRDDNRAPKASILFAVPTASYEAYNDWGGKSLYLDSIGGPETIAGDPRAVKVSFDRPLADPRRNNTFFGPDFYLVQWLEKQGYDVSYTEDVSLHQNPSQLLGHKIDLVSGHSEYWSLEQYDGYLGARNAGVNLASFSANTTFWKVRYEDGGRTLVCYKTVQGSGSTGSGSDGANDWGPDGLLHTADDALGADGNVGGTGANADHPENSTTTFRDNGAPDGDPNAPDGGRVGPDKPENQLWGSMYYGAELAAGAFPLQVPATNAQTEFSGDRIWRATGMSTSSTTTIGTNIVGWEWDAIPTQSQYLSKQPAGVKRLTNTTFSVSPNINWLQDEGRAYSTSAPPGQPLASQAVKYTAPSGALVFSTGTNDWANALAVNPDSRIIQATYNILADEGVQPGTPIGLTLDPPSGPQPPTASFTLSPNPAQTGQLVSFDATSSTDPDGPITKYEWDLDGDGTYELDGGTTPTVTHTYTSSGVITVRLRVTDGQGVRSTTNRALSVDNTGGGSYPSRVLGTTGLTNYWRMGDTSGTALVDSFGSANATTVGAPTLGATGALFSDNDTAVTFDGTNDAASAALNLSGTNKLTVEFWMKWSGYADDDRLAMEFTPNFNSTAGGFIIDPNAPQGGGKFAVSIGDVGTRNNVIFDRPSAGKWHHYAFVLDTSAAAASQILPYVDGSPVTYTKLASGTGAGNFANSILYFMSRATSALFGRGDLDEVSIYNRALPPATIAAHYAGNPQPPVASITSSADPASVGQLVTFDGSGSTSPTGAITKYEWDLDGNGSYETDTGTTPTATHTYSAAGNVDVKLRVTDSAAKTATSTVSISVEQPGTGTYTDRVRNTAGLTHYWRMGELTGGTLADSKGSSNATISGGPALGAPGAVDGDADTSVRFNGTSSAATANVDLSGTSKLTVEFWMKWNGYANDDDLAMEFTSNFNANAGGFLIDPNESGGKFAVSIGDSSSRNNVVFNRPSAGQWHHYAFVIDTGAVAASQIIPYVDGQLVAYTKLASGTGAGNFANSQLYLMSRAAGSLFGAGDLDEVAMYNRALSAATISGHYGGNVQPPTAAFTAGPDPAQLGQTVTFDGSGSNSPNGAISKYEWDLDGNGSYETDTGTTPTATKAYTAAATVNVKLRVTDSTGATATVTHAITVEAPGAGSYASRVLGTGGLSHFWRMGDASGTTLTDSKGTSPATLIGAPALGVAGALAADTDTATSFSGSGDAASADVDLSGTNKATLEFWLKWDSYANDDRLAFELTPNFNQNAGGLLVDPNESGGKFAVSIGHGDARNSVTFDRPSAGAWHHYALALDTSAAGTGQITPYVDGDAVAFTQLSSGTGMGNFANSQLYFMSRAGNSLFGNGDLDEVAIYSRALSAATISDHYGGTGGGSGEAPTAAFSSSPSNPLTSQTVTFDGSASADPDGTIAKYQWDLDGNGSYETDTGTTATATKSYAAVGSVDVRLRVTDNSGTTASVTHTVTIANRTPTASFTVSPNPSPVNQPVAFDASASSDPDGSITKYEWDLDGNGTYETDTGTTKTATRTYTAATSVDVKVRVTDDRGATATQTKTLTFLNSNPTASFTATPNPVVSGATATFDGSLSSDPDGTITKYEWDLDGNGSFETNTGTTKTTTRSYATPGTVAVQLRVTDNLGATATKTVSVTVSNRAPTASFTVSPSPAATRQTVTLNGAGSTDPDGTIAKYEWDLDGNGTYEVDGGATSSRTLTFTTPGTFTLGLRVTDNNSATAITTRSLVVNSAYRTAILGTAGISDYWRLDDTATTAVDANGANNNGTYVNGPVTAAGLLAGETNNARTFDGSNDYVDMSPTPFGSPSQFSVETWVRTSATKAANGYHFLVTDSSAELSGNSLSLSDGFSLVVDPSNRAVFQIARNIIFSTTRATVTSSVTLAPNTIHHVVATYDGSTARLYVDGVQVGTGTLSGGVTWSGSRDLRLGRPIESSAAQFFLQGTLDETAVYTQAMPAATVLAHYNTGKP